MRTICIFNHKGGVGKTTTALNLAAGLSRHEKKVLLVDLDPQGNLDVSLKANAMHSVYDALQGQVPIEQCIVNVAKNFDMICSTETLTKMEHHLVNDEQNHGKILRNLLGKINGYDFMLIDCPPSLGMLNQDVLSFCQEAFVPVATDFLGVDALKKMPEIVATINKHFNHTLKITKVIPTMYDRRNKICKEMLALIQQTFPLQASHPIRNNTKIKEAPKYGKSIFSHAKSSPGAQDYGKLVEDVLAMGA
ncbi:ParA family protein [Candidatus Woesearchaeota archaeon]|nr:ParA family protein [Candidatus Woesearchaeota archaeon]